MTELSAVAVDRVRLRLLGGWHLLVDGVDVGLGHREQRLVALVALTGCSARAQVAAAAVARQHRTSAPSAACVARCCVRQAVSRAARRASVDHRARPDGPGRRGRLRRAAGLTQLPMSGEVARELLAALGGDELLPGWYDDWVIAERDGLQHLRVEALDRVARQSLDAGELGLAIEAARATSDIDPLLEPPREVSIRAHLGRRRPQRRRARVPALPQPHGGGARHCSLERDPGTAGPGVALPPSPAPLEPATHPDVLPVESLFPERPPDPLTTPSTTPSTIERDEPPTGPAAPT